MKFRKTLLPICSVLLISLIVSCGKDKKTGDLYFKNDVDMEKGWNHHNPIMKGPAHTGKYFTKIDSLDIYSITFIAKLGDISDKPLKKVKTNVWALVKNLNAKAKFAIAIDSAGRSISWNAGNLEDFIKTPNEWQKMENTVDLSKQNNPAYTLTVYVWNGSKEEIYLDDFEVEFTE